MNDKKEFEVVYSSELNDQELRKIVEDVLELDSQVYSSEFQGTFSSVMNRVLANRDCLIMVRVQDKVVGYICFFPICDELYNEIMSSDNFYDNDIVGNQIIDYGIDTNLFIISLVISKEYRNGEVIKILNNNFKEWIRKKMISGIEFQHFIAYSISRDGMKWLQQFGFDSIKKITETEVLYIMNKSKIEELL